MIRPAQPSDEVAWKHLRQLLWPDATAELSDEERAALVTSERDFAVFVSENDARLTGFVEVSLRKYADGCDSSPVAFLEGIFVEPESRGQGLARQLVSAAEAWARARGCTEIASDTLLANSLGERMHHALGYEEVERVIRFRKDLAR